LGVARRVEQPSVDVADGDQAEDPLAGGMGGGLEDPLMDLLMTHPEEAEALLDEEGVAEPDDVAADGVESEGEGAPGAPGEPPTKEASLAPGAVADKKKKRNKAARGTGTSGTRISAKLDKSTDKKWKKDAAMDADKRGKLQRRKRATKLKGAIMGALGNETRAKLDSFAKGTGPSAMAGATSGTGSEEYTDAKGTVHKENTATARAGAFAETSILAEDKKVDADGNVLEHSRAGAKADAYAGAKADATASTFKSKRGVGAQASGSARAGVGGSATAGASHEKQLTKGVKGYGGAEVSQDRFAGARGHAEAGASTTGLSAEAHGSAGGFAGLEAGAKVGGEAGIKAGGFDLVGARANGKMRIMAGAEGNASGSTKVGLIEGAQAKGEADVMAGVKAEGSASAGVSLGGADADVNAEGTAMAGAEADARGAVGIGPTGVKAEGEASAFAGAKAEGSASFDIGAGGLNLAVLTVEGEASAGIGGEIGGNITAFMGKLGAGAKAAGTVGVGAGVGGKVELDLFFPIRLTLAKLAENKVISSGDPNELAWDGMKWVWEEGGGKAEVDKGVKDTLKTGADIGDVIKASPGYAEDVLTEARDSATSKISEAYGEIKTGAGTMMGFGQDMMGAFLSVLKGAFAKASSLYTGALTKMDDVASKAMDMAGSLAGSMMSFGASCLNEIRDMAKISGTTLMSMDWNAAIDAVVAKIDAFVAKIRAQIDALIAKTIAKLASMAEAAAKFIAAPFMGAIDAVAGVLGGFGKKCSSLALKTLKKLMTVAKGAEKGIEVEELGGRIKMPVKISDDLQTAKAPLEGLGGFFGKAAKAGVADAVNSIIGAVGDAIVGAVPEKAEKVTKGVGDLAMNAVKNATSPVKSVVLGVKKAIGWAIELAQRAIALAKKLAAAAANAAKKVGKAVKKFFKGW
jgi:hypothetical protein